MKNQYRNIDQKEDFFSCIVNLLSFIIRDTHINKLMNSYYHLDFIVENEKIYYFDPDRISKINDPYFQLGLF